jgi:hypothetical protein
MGRSEAGGFEYFKFQISDFKPDNEVEPLTSAATVSDERLCRW